MIVDSKQMLVAIFCHRVRYLIGMKMWLGRLGVIGRIGLGVDILGSVVEVDYRNLHLHMRTLNPFL